MAKTNRNTLKGYFGSGKRPGSDQFQDLIDSMLNIVDDGFNKSAERGMLLSPLDDEGAVMEIRRNILIDEPEWVLALGKNGELEIQHGSEKNILVKLCPDGRIEIGGNKKVKLTVNGTVEADQFVGGYLQGKAPADGLWHDIGEMEYGCRAYHITAACGLKNSGKYALADVTAMHCFGRHAKVWHRRSWFGTGFSRIQFRWKRIGMECGLQVRTRSNYGEDVLVDYKISTLIDKDFANK